MSSDTEGKLRAALVEARDKLEIYFHTVGGKYVGGLEYSLLMKQIETALAKPSSPSGGGWPDGWKLVPVEPTEEMLIAVARSIGASIAKPNHIVRAREAYQAMLAAAPNSGGDGK